MFRPRSARPSRAVVLAVTALTLSLPLAACGSSGAKTTATTASSWSQVLAAADTEGSLQLYSSSSPDTNTKLAAAFQQQYPKIKLNVLRVTTPESEQRADAEFNGHAKGADVIINTDEKWHQAKSSQEGYFLDITGPDVTTAPQILQYNARTALVTANPHGYAWNTTLVGPTLDWNSVTDPKYDGKIGIYDFCPSDENVLEFDLWSQLYGGDTFLQKLAAMHPKFYSNAVATAQDLGSGAIAVALPMTRSSYGNVPQIQMAYMPQGVSTIASPFFASIAGWATHPNAAEVFVNWLLTQGGQTAYAGQNKIAVAGTDVPGAELTLSQVTVVHSAQVEQSAIDDMRTKLEKTFSHNC